MDLDAGLNDAAFFSDVTEEERAALSNYVERQTVAIDQQLFCQGDASDALFVVLSGAIKVVAKIADEVEKPLVVVRAGQVLGELSLITGEPRNGTATALEATELCVLQRDAFYALAEAHPALGEKLLQRLLKTVAQRLQFTTRLYTQAVAWGMQVSDAVSLDFAHLVAHQQEIHVSLVSGTETNGRLVKVESSDHGQTLLLQRADNSFVMIPYRAVAAIRFEAATELDNGKDLSMSQFHD